MCGMFGVASARIPVDTELANSCLELIRHRGPDHQGVWNDGFTYLGHQRLTIIDLSPRGNQPMTDAENSAIVMVNGEIYNYKTLRKQLSVNRQFYSDSDSEVVLHGFLEWGISRLLARLEGMYALSIYDLKTNRIYLARDRIGIKPLYYSLINGQLIWASELKSVQRYLKNSLTLDKTAFYDFLTYRYIPSPKTTYNEVSKLEPASLMEYNLNTGNLALSRYWQPETVAGFDTSDPTCRIQEEILSSLEEHMVGDVPVNFFLSGGIDSSLLAALACQQKYDVNTYSININARGFNEGFYSNLVAEHISSNHHSKTFDASDSALLFENMKGWYDEPFADFSALPTYYLCRFLSDNGGKVAISGEGADEVFGGYQRYFHKYLNSPPSYLSRTVFSTIKRLCDLAPYYSRIWRLGRLIGNRAIYSGFELYAELIGSLPVNRKQYYRKYLEIDEDYDDYWFFRKYWLQDLPPLKRIQYLDIHTYLPEDLLTKLDRVSMATSLEVRVPYLCHSLVENVLAIPEEHRNPNGKPKELLANIATSYLPDEIISRRKKGFGLPKEFRTDANTGLFIYPQEKILNDHFASELNLA